MEFKSYSIKFSKSIAREKRRNINMVRNKLNILEALPKEKIGPQSQKEIESLKKQDFEFNRSRIEGFLVRLKIPIFEEGEGDISYFSRLEKRKGEEN